MVKKEIFKNMNNNNDKELELFDEIEIKGKMLFDIFIGSMPVFIDGLIEHFEKIKIKNNQVCDIVIDVNEFINIIQPKINILCYYLEKVNYNINIIVESDYPKTKIKFVDVDNQFVQYLKDVKFLIFCEYHKNLGHA